MTRQIKFRVWDKGTEKYLTPSSKEFTMTVFDSKGIISLGKEGEEHIVFQQFTGLVDKNGKEIYEGDIVNQDGTIYQIKYGIQEVDAFEGIGWNMWSFFDSDENGYNANGKRLTKELEIIGNIWENPKLLK